MSTALRNTPMKSWSPPDGFDTLLTVDLRVGLMGTKNGFRLWAGYLEGANVPVDLVGKLVSYAPSGGDGLLAATVGNEPPFVMAGARLTRVVGVER